jgi:cardiolipin synthase (CMP-forming)
MTSKPDGENAARLSWIPNGITWARLLSGPVILASVVFSAHSENPLWPIMAAIVYFIGAATDWIDGSIARSLKATSAYGQALDPKADKMFGGGALIGLAIIGVLGGLNLIPVMVLIGRDLWISHLRGKLAAIGQSMPPSALAKAKTAVELTGLGFLVCTPGVGIMLKANGLAGGFPDVTLMQVGLAMVWAAAVLSAVTGWQYTRHANSVLGRSAA